MSARSTPFMDPYRQDRTPCVECVRREREKNMQPKEPLPAHLGILATGGLLTLFMMVLIGTAAVVVFGDHRPWKAATGTACVGAGITSFVAAVAYLMKRYG